MEAGMILNTEYLKNYKESHVWFFQVSMLQGFSEMLQGFSGMLQGFSGMLQGFFKMLQAFSEMLQGLL